MLRIFLAYFSGLVLTPVLLPYIPGRYFSVKGFLAGSLVFAFLLLFKMAGKNIAEIVSWFLLITGISSYFSMNFTGSSTFTSLSGVKKEMKFSIPAQITFGAAGLILQIIGKFI